MAFLYLKKRKYSFELFLHLRLKFEIILTKIDQVIRLRNDLKYSVCVCVVVCNWDCSESWDINLWSSQQLTISKFDCILVALLAQAVKYADSISADGLYPNTHPPHTLTHDSPGYHNQLYDSEASVLELWECGIPHHWHYSWVHSDPMC